MFSRLILVVVLATTLITCGPAATAPRNRPLTQVTGIPAIDRVIVDPTNVKRSIPATFFGVNYVAFWEPAEGSAAAARALAQTPIRVVRFPGGDPGDKLSWAPTQSTWQAIRRQVPAKRGGMGRLQQDTWYPRGHGGWQRRRPGPDA